MPVKMNIITLELKVCDVEIGIILFVKIGSLKFIIPQNRKK